MAKKRKHRDIYGLAYLLPLNNSILSIGQCIDRVVYTGTVMKIKIYNFKTRQWHIGPSSGRAFNACAQVSLTSKGFKHCPELQLLFSRALVAYALFWIPSVCTVGVFTLCRRICWSRNRDACNPCHLISFWATVYCWPDFSAWEFTTPSGIDTSGTSCDVRQLLIYVTAIHAVCMTFINLGIYDSPALSCSSQHVWDPEWLVQRFLLFLFTSNVNKLKLGSPLPKTTVTKHSEGNIKLVTSWEAQLPNWFIMQLHMSPWLCLSLSDSP